MSIQWNPDNFKVLREVLGLSVEEMAKKIGVTPKQLVGIEKGQRYATMTVLAQASRVYSDNLHRVHLSLKEGEEADGIGFLTCLQQEFPMSSGGSTISPPDDRATAFVDLLMPEVDEGYIRKKVKECADRNNIELLELKIT